MQYRKEIDGLRAIAVLPVIFFHAGFPFFQGGYVGVDVFFVISGYLITSIIYEEIRRDKFKISNFYERRIRRILPALFTVVVACFPFAWVWMTPDQLKEFSQSIVAVVTFTANIEFWKESGYFAPAVELSPLLHTWSLAVEEQYYVFFPVLIYLLWKINKSLIVPALSLIFLLSLATSHWSSERYPNANFYLIHTRLWELMLGSLLALLPKPKQPTEGQRIPVRYDLLSTIGFSLVLYSIAVFDSNTPFPSLYALIPTVGTALLLRYAVTGTRIGSLLKIKPLVGIGLISYSAYLWHQPLFAFARLRSLLEPHWQLMLALSALSLLLAYIGWRYIESPFRDKTRTSRRQIFRYAKFSALALICIGITGSVTKGFPMRTLESGETLGSLQERVGNNHGLDDNCSGQFTLAPECRTHEAPEILVWGDSYAMHLLDGIMQSNPQAKVIQHTKSGCGPILNIAPVTIPSRRLWATRCMDFNNRVAAWVKENTSLKYAVLASPFGQYLSGDGKQLLLEDGQLVPTSAELAEEYISSTLDFLASEGIRPVIFSPPPSNGEDIGMCLVRSTMLGRDPATDCSFRLSELTAERKNVFRFLDKLDKRYRVVHLSPSICPDGLCMSIMDGKFIYADSGHLSHEGSAHLGKVMDFHGLITSE